MTNQDANEHSMQSFRARSSTEILYVETHLDKKTGERFVLWFDIQQVFKHVGHVLNGGAVVSFIKDDEFKVITPTRIKYHSDTVLEVVMDDMDSTVNKPFDPNSSSLPVAMPSIHSIDAGISGEFIPTCGNPTGVLRTEENDLQLASALVGHPRSDSLVAYSAVVTPKPQSSLESYGQLCSSYLHAIMNGQANHASIIMTSMAQHFGNLQAEMDKNSKLQKEMHHMQLEMDKKQQQIISMQLQMEEKQKEMIQLQKQTLDRLAIIQNRVQAVLTQTYELHEYPIPRLFIILPKPTKRRDIF
ncbi:hypothetical protein BGX27_009871, partial [Mortierella sp. AM989]